MTTVVLAVVTVVLLAGFVALYFWSRCTERDVISWQRRRQTSAERQATQFGTAINLLGSVDR
jgi:hypothetical protein